MVNASGGRGGNGTGWAAPYLKKLCCFGYLQGQSQQGNGSCDRSIVETGVDQLQVWISQAYKNTELPIAKFTYLDGDQENCSYRGFRLKQIRKAQFHRVMYLLLNGEYQYKEQIPTVLKVNIKNSPYGCIIFSNLLALTAFNPKAVDVNSKEDLDHAAELMIAKFAHLCAWTYRKTQGLPLNHGDNKLNYVENFYKMAFRLSNEEFELDPVV
ncbi:hypothetical protein FQR65_LT18628 [Abscondita terminalis]|nr:hypothetical protein FQR65_LT18628 [Abscondita terminalis]